MCNNTMEEVDFQERGRKDKRMGYIVQVVSGILSFPVQCPSWILKKITDYLSLSREAPTDGDSPDIDKQQSQDTQLEITGTANATSSKPLFFAKQVKINKLIRFGPEQENDMTGTNGCLFVRLVGI